MASSSKWPGHLDYPASACRLSALARAAGGRWSGQMPRREMGAREIGTDSRTLRPGQLFVPLVGEHFDGHTFLADAKAGGALAALVAEDKLDDATRRLGADWPLLIVKDTCAALGDIAHHLRAGREGKVVGITGSNGKTTTKEILAAALTHKGIVHKTHGNLNNLIGVPKTLFSWPANAWAAVVEMGMNAPGEISRLTRIADPDVGLITCVAAAHLEGLGDLASVARAKLELLDALRPDRVMVLNQDDPELMREAKPRVQGRPCLYFGGTPQADVQLVDATPSVDGGMQVTLRFGTDGAFSGRLPLLGRHNAHNAAGAAACAWALGLAPQAIVEGMAFTQVPGGRLRHVRAQKRGLDLLDDTYNANPGSMSAALKTLRACAQERSGARQIAILGDMLELGPEAATLHQALGAEAAQSGAQLIFALGAFADAVAESARAAGATAQSFASQEALLTALQAATRPGDWLLIKGSRGMHMEQIVAALTQD